MSHGTSAAHSAPTLAGWAGFIAICIGMSMAILDVQIVATLLLTVQDALSIQPDQMV
jgi:DHA2 family multidrug resistance protein